MYIPSELQIFSSIRDRIPELKPRGVVACKDTNLSYISIESAERVSSLALSLKLLAFIQNSTRALSDRPFLKKKEKQLVKLIYYYEKFPSKHSTTYLRFLKIP